MRAEFIFDQNYNKVVFGATDIMWKEFENCYFRNCNLSACNYTSTVFTDCHFENCNFDGAAVHFTSIRDCNFTSCSMRKINFAMIDQTIMRFNFTNCKLDFCQFYELPMNGISFSNCSLIGCDFADAKLQNALFDNCNLHQAVFKNADARRADFLTSYNYVIDPEETQLTGATFSKHGLEGLLKKHRLFLK